ncbi:protein mesh-like [Panonychus citri]|uniref:protein mesh-like n=1 Tax=Panonychus citri TaxID=50023 RepID=UPI002307F4C5|nr:protein mesh-like [Panonychus citri]
MLTRLSLIILALWLIEKTTGQSERQGTLYGNVYPGSSLRINPVMTPELQDQRRQLMYPYNLSYILDINQNKPIHDQPLSFRLPFFGFEFNYAYVQLNGHLAFNKGLLSYRFPLQFPMQPTDPLSEEDPSLIAIWFAQQDIPGQTEIPNAGVYLQMVIMEQETNTTLRDRLILDFREGMIGAADFTPKFAMIITWKNMTFVARREEKPLKTNSYQMVLATDEMRTYVMFNYEQVEWITSKDNYDGLKGPPAFIGFNAGNTTRAFEYKPYSQEPRVKIMTQRGFGNGLEGRYFFQIDEEIWPGCCINKDLNPNLKDRLPLTFFPRWGHMLGGTLVNVTGPCFEPDDIITCNFDNQVAKGIYRDPNHATCISPPVFYHGYIDLSITVQGKTIFLGRYYVQPPDIADDAVVVLDDMDRLESPEKLTIKWKPERLAWLPDAPVSISLWGYRESSDLYPKLTFIDTLEEGVRLGAQQADLLTERYRDRVNHGATDLLFGFIAINLTNPTILGKQITQSPMIWSRAMPLAWYFRRQWEREYGLNGRWKNYLCNDWYEKEKYGDAFATTVFRCPCTRLQADLDRGRFSPDLECNIQDRKCEIFHKGAQHCVVTGRPSIGGSGQSCCYDDYMELLQTADTMYGGRPSKAFMYGKHPFKMRMMIPVLSSYLHDVMPFFFCCKWQPEEDDSDTCQKYNYWRTSQDCSSYQAPGIASIYGDPHFVTFDNHSYTFNGKGEFVLSRVEDASAKIEVQARFEQVPRKLRIDQNINATYLTAIAARDNQSATVEFRIRPKAARWRYQMYCIVDREYVFFWDASLRVQNFRGVTLYQPADIRNMSHIIAMFDSGAGVEVMANGGSMTVHVYLPPLFQNKTYGLLGFYSSDKFDDFMLPNGAGRVPITTGMEDLHNRFGKSWRVAEGSDKPGVGHSLFWHDAFSFAAYDDLNFIPEYRLPPEELRLPDSKRHLEAEMKSICADSVTCKYDYIMTLDPAFAKVSKTHETWAHELQLAANMTVRRCPALPKPRFGRKTENKYYPGITVRFACDDGYRLVGHEYRWCRSDGLWSWGYEAQCISTGSYAGFLSLYIFGVIIPIVLILTCCIFCLLRSNRRAYDHYTGEPGIHPGFNEFNTKMYQKSSQPKETQMLQSKPVASIPTQAIEAEIN